MGSSVKYIGVTITDYDYDGYEWKGSAAEKLDICLKKKQSEAVLAFLSLLGKNVFVSLPIYVINYSWHFANFFDFMKS